MDFSARFYALVLVSAVSLFAFWVSEASPSPTIVIARFPLPSITSVAQDPAPASAWCSAASGFNTLVDSNVSLPFAIPLKCPSDPTLIASLSVDQPNLSWGLSYQARDTEWNHNVSMSHVFQCVSIYPAEDCSQIFGGSRVGRSDGAAAVWTSDCPQMQINLFEKVIQPGSSQCVTSRGWVNPSICRIGLQLNIAYSSLCVGILRVKQPILIFGVPEQALVLVGSNVDILSAHSSVALVITVEGNGRLLTSSTGMPKTSVEWLGSARQLNQRLHELRFIGTSNITESTVIRLVLRAGLEQVETTFLVLQNASSQPPIPNNNTNNTTSPSEGFSIEASVSNNWVALIITAIIVAVALIALVTWVVWNNQRKAARRMRLNSIIEQRHSDLDSSLRKIRTNPLETTGVGPSSS